MKANQQNIELLLDALASRRNSEEIRGKLRKTRIGIRLTLLATCLFLIFILFLDVPEYIQQSNWWGLFFFIWSFIAAVFAFPAIRREMNRWLAVPGKAPALREQLRDEQLVPLAAQQPASLQGDDLPLAPTRIAPLKRWKASMAVSIVFGLFFLLLGLGGIWGFTWMLTNPDAGFQPGPYLPLIEFIGLLILANLLILFCCGLGIFFLIAAWRAPRGASVIADDWGLLWRKSGWGQQSHAALAWHDVQGFYLVTYQDKKNRSYQTYFLDGRESAFLWRLIPCSTPAILAASERLASLIVARARLPLRDLSALLTSAVSQEPEPAPIAAQADIKQP